MKKSAKLQILILASLGLVGCHLEQAPDCLNGQKKCRNDAVLNQGILQVCMENNTWQEISCLGACVDNKSCGESEVILSCAENGEKKCVSTDNASYSFMCIEHQWIPGVCGGKDQCDGNVCLASQSSCEEGARMCTYIDILGQSVASVCRDGRWISNFCQEDQSCSESGVCADKSEITTEITSCGSEHIDCTAIDGWDSGKCEESKCIVTKCVEGKHIYSSGGVQICEDNTVEHCGSHEAVCNTDSISNSESVECTAEGVCNVTACGNGFHIFGNTCEANDVEHCGSHDSVCNTDAVNGSTGVECTAEGVCKATACKNYYDLNDGKCEAAPNEDCFGELRACGVNKYCFNLQYDLYNCGECGKECGNDQICDEGECKDIKPACEGNYIKQKVIRAEMVDWNVKFEEKEVNAFCIDDELILKNLKAALLSGDHVVPKNNTDNAYILLKDLTISKDAFSIGNIEIGSSYHMYSVFDGVFIANDHKLSGGPFKEEMFRFDDSEYELGVGFFGCLQLATVLGGHYEFTIESQDAEYSNFYEIGGLAGSINQSYVSDVNVDVRMKINKHIEKYSDNIGGFAGHAVDSILNNIHVERFEFSPFNLEPNPTLQHVGGLVGTLESDSQIKNSGVNHVKIHNTSASGSSGGLVGIIHGSDIVINNTYVNKNEEGLCEITGLTDDSLMGAFDGQLFESSEFVCDSECSATCTCNDAPCSCDGESCYSSIDQ